MPCIHEGPEDRAEQLRTELDRVTRLLCYALDAAGTFWIDDLDEGKPLAVELEAWADKHRAADRERRRRELYEHAEHKRRAAALAKLTREDREALGL